jgi:hypothetical protein
VPGVPVVPAGSNVGLGLVEVCGLTLDVSLKFSLCIARVLEATLPLGPPVAQAGVERALLTVGPVL